MSPTRHSDDMSYIYHTDAIFHFAYPVRFLAEHCCFQISLTCLSFNSILLSFIYSVNYLVVTLQQVSTCPYSDFKVTSIPTCNFEIRKNSVSETASHGSPMMGPMRNKTNQHCVNGDERTALV